MIRVCPEPNLWYEIYLSLEKYAEANVCIPEHPPRALVLSSWTFSNDLDRKVRWEETLLWASDNNCLDLIEGIPDSEFYEVEELSTYQIGPNGGRMIRAWDYEEKKRPSPEVLEIYLDKLITNWESIAGEELSSVTKPFMFTGEKARRLVVHYQESHKPPWGGWSHLSEDETERITFTKFRAAVNEAISPHEVDHIDFCAGI